MKYIKKFEEINNVVGPKIGDYVLCNEKPNNYNDLDIFLSNNVGNLIEIINNPVYPYKVTYDNIPNNLKSGGFIVKNSKFFRLFGKDELKYWSEDKKELEAILAGNKYNI